MIKRNPFILAALAASCASAPKVDPVRVAIAEIGSKVNRNGPPLADLAVDHLQDRLVSCSRLIVVERMRLDRIIEEQRPDSSGLGKLSGADWVVYGAITEVVYRGEPGQGELRHIGEVELNLRVIRVEDGRIVFSKGHRGSAEGPPNSIPESLLNRATRAAVDKLAGEIVKLAP
ncbi:MAG TPA: CsgG/HfaB family protein [Planctomycetota bacterium]|nr:CsgG/HfaB family protein [Planctomycetota bacterium]